MIINKLKEILINLEVIMKLLVWFRTIRWKSRAFFAALMFLAFLINCGGPGAGGGSDDPLPSIINYSIGGTVSGLSGTLVLQNNGSDNLSINSNAAFIFETAIADGSSYNVTVSSQPTEQTCSVSNGTGTLDGDDVSNVTVTCSTDTYTIGGTVSGLSGTLVLQNNGSDNLSINSNAAFIFETTIADGSAYTVTASSQPFEQTCSVSNGTGTLDGADVSNVTVTCSTDTYAIGGTVSGLSGSLLLQNNGSDDLSVDANGPFNFSTEVADNTSYSAALDSSPLLQNCAVSNESGTVSADITNITVICSDKVWADPSDIDDFMNPIADNGNTTLKPQVNMSPEGDAIVNWSQESASGMFSFRVFKSEYRSGSWSGPSVKTDFISPDRFSVASKTAMSSNGDAVMVWSGWDNNTDCTGVPCYQTFYAEYRNSVWSYPSDADDNISPNTTDSNDQSVFIDTAGNTLILWRQDDASGDSQIFKSEYRSGSWTHPSGLSDNISPDGSDVSYPDAAMDSNGNAIIVWSQNSKIYRTEYRSGSWDSPEIISPGVRTATQPSVAMSSNGDAVITWRQIAAIGGYRIFKSEYRNGSWNNPGDSDYIGPQVGGTTAVTPRVVMDSGGNTIIVWRQQDGSGDYQIFKSEYRSGSWTHPTDLSDNISPDGSDAGTDATLHYPRIAMDDNGNAIVVWQQFDNSSNRQIFRAVYQNSSWTIPSGLSDTVSPAGSTCFYPQVSVDNLGNAIIVWQQQDSSNDYQIFMSEFR